MERPGHLTCVAAARPTSSVDPDPDVGQPSAQSCPLHQSQLPELTPPPNEQASQCCGEKTTQITWKDGDELSLTP
jgi:hypothetical protein